MSWGSKIFGGGRWSPFNRSESNQVTEDDYSYITEADLARSGQTGTAKRPTRDADIVIFRHNKTTYPVHFPGYSIDNGTLTVGAVRQKAASEIGVQEARRIRMFSKGRQLKEDNKAMRDEAFTSGKDSDILVVVGSETPLPRPAASRVQTGATEETVSEGESVEADPTAPKKKKRVRKGKKKAKSSAETSGTTTPSIPPPPAAPLTPLAKLEAIASTFHTKFVPLCVQYQMSPPTDPAKRDFEHKKLTETIFQQILLKVDGIEVEGDPEARAKRKELVREVQGMLNSLDAVVVTT
jgi:hypothetical protein